MLFSNPWHLKTDLPGEDMSGISSTSHGAKAPLGSSIIMSEGWVSREMLQRITLSIRVTKLGTFEPKGFRNTYLREKCYTEKG